MEDIVLTPSLEGYKRILGVLQDDAEDEEIRDWAAKEYNRVDTTERLNGHLNCLLEIANRLDEEGNPRHELLRRTVNLINAELDFLLPGQTKVTIS